MLQMPAVRFDLWMFLSRRTVPAPFAGWINLRLFLMA